MVGSRHVGSPGVRIVVAGAQDQRVLVGDVLVEQTGACAQAHPALRHDAPQHFVVLERSRNGAAGLQQGGEPPGLVAQVGEGPGALGDVVQRDQPALWVAGAVDEGRHAHLEAPLRRAAVAKLELPHRRGRRATHLRQRRPPGQGVVHRPDQSLGSPSEELARAGIDLHEPFLPVDDQHSVRQGAKQRVAGQGDDREESLTEQDPAQQQHAESERQGSEIDVLVQRGEAGLVDDVGDQRQRRDGDQRQRLPPEGRRAGARRLDEPHDADRHQQIGVDDHRPQDRSVGMAVNGSGRHRHGSHIRPDEASPVGYDHRRAQRGDQPEDHHGPRAQARTPGKGAHHLQPAGSDGQHGEALDLGHGHFESQRHRGGAEAVGQGPRRRRQAHTGQPGCGRHGATPPRDDSHGRNPARDQDQQPRGPALLPFVQRHASSEESPPALSLTIGPAGGVLETHRFLAKMLPGVRS